MLTIRNNDIMKKRTKNVIRTLAGIIIALVIIGGLICLIDGRSPQAIIIGHAFTQATLEDYELEKGDKTDKSTVEIPGDVTFPREMRQYRVGDAGVSHGAPRRQ